MNDREMKELENKRRLLLKSIEKLSKSEYIEEILNQENYL